ncbi:MAG: helix-turn-helix transcriptional regulator [Synechococcus sp.]
MQSQEPLTVNVLVLPISQATTETLTDLFFHHALLVFIQVGSKRVLCPVNGELVGHADDLIIFPSGSMVTLENRPVLGHNYRATGVCFPRQMIDAVFPKQVSRREPIGIQHLPAARARFTQVLTTLQATLADSHLPAPIRQHRLLEPLIWLKHHGINLTPDDDNNPLTQVRQLIETDLSHPWRSGEVASHFGMSEATMRRWLMGSGQGFSKILQNTRLEHGLSLLQSTEIPISGVALDCGFKAPAHFSESFKKRFGIKPSEIRKRAG